MSEAGSGPRAIEEQRDALVALVVAGLRRPLDPGEEKRLDRLIAIVPDGRAIADTTVDQWIMAGILGRDGMAEVAEGEVASTGIQPAATPLPESPGRRRLLRMGGGGLVAAVAGIAGVAGWQRWRTTDGAGGPEQVIAAGGTGTMRTRLADGSVVLLSRHARIATVMSDDVRRVRHLSGEAFYQVAHDPARPFVVEVAGYQLTALGTGFNVDPLGDALRVDLLDGRLRIAAHDGGRGLVLNAGQRFVGGPEDHVATADPDAAAWGEGRLVFDDEPLRLVALRLAAHSDVALVLQDDRVGALRFSGVMAIDDPRSWKVGLESTLPVRAIRQGNALRISPTA